MHRKEVNLQSPLRIVDRAIRGGLGKGHLGAIVAPPGVGKTACLVAIGLDALMRDRHVLHVALGQTVEHVAAAYDALFDELAERFDLGDRAGVREAIARRRLIWSLPEGGFGPQPLDEALAAFRTHLELGPSAVLVDGFAWEAPGAASTLGAVKASAAAAGAELWMTARPARPDPGRPGVVPLPDGCASLVDVALHLAPRGRDVRVELVKDFDALPAADLPLVVRGGTLRILREAAGAAAERPPEAFTLLATASAGAEEEFGACAERWGVQEVNFTFGGRGEIARTRGLVALSEDELRVGEVSLAYVKAHLHRALPETAAFGRVLQAIWHQVSSAGEVFSVGTVTPDKTAHGGTGWAVELARHWGKPVHLFDEERQGWLRWDGRDWAAEAPPEITRARFAGAGTRSPSHGARVAIRGLFERSFGPPGCVDA